METIDIDIRLRPIRFGYLVRPSDAKSLRAIFQTNTCLWGGLFNPIIPFISKVPTWWERHGIRFDNAKQIMNGYLDFFEPDFLVEAEAGMGADLGFDPSRVVALADVLRRRGEGGHKGVGLDVLDLYHKLYREEFQFARRHPTIAMDVEATGALQTFSACIFGALPGDPALTHFRDAFEAIFEPERIDLDEAAFLRLHGPPEQDTSRITALRLGSDGLEIDYNRTRDRIIFVLDATQPADLIDFWNLRTFERDVLVMPVQWLGIMSPFCRTVIRDGHRPLQGNPNGVMTHVTVLFSRSIADADIPRLFAEHMQVDQVGANVLQNWYPPIWRPTPEIMARQTRPLVTAARSPTRVAVGENLNVRFQGLEPDFASKYGSDHRWANVLSFETWGTKDRLATVFPTDVRKNFQPDHLGGDEPPVSTMEGLVAFRQFKQHDIYWKLQSGTDAISRWLRREGVKATPSDAGRATQQIIHTLEGFHGVGALANKDVVIMLDSMARSHTRSSHQQKFKQQVQDAVGKSLWGRGTLETLVRRKAVELGYELKCSNCGSWTWHPLAALAANITCDLCLQSFPFPITDPSNGSHARWAYRVIGPFALTGYANGGYASALAIRLFGTFHGLRDPGITWASGQDLHFDDGSKSEIDFIVWYQRKNIGRISHPTEIIFGEAKSFGGRDKERFEDKDVARLKELAQRFPGSICVFATLRDRADFQPAEIERLRRFAEWGRRSRTLHRPRAPVLILTGTELFARHGVELAWKDAGGLRAELVEPAWVRTEDLVSFADMTQQAYLGMQSRDRWLDERWKARDERRKRRGPNPDVQAADPAGKPGRPKAETR